MKLDDVKALGAVAACFPYPKHVIQFLADLQKYNLRAKAIGVSEKRATEILMLSMSGGVSISDGIEIASRRLVDEVINA